MALNSASGGRDLSLQQQRTRAAFWFLVPMLTMLFCVAALGGESPVERPGGKCERDPEQQAKNLPDGVLWVQPSQDASSNVTGSSVFDFDGDGQAEAVYRDECFIRVYNGRTAVTTAAAIVSSVVATPSDERRSSRRRGIGCCSISVMMRRIACTASFG